MTSGGGGGGSGGGSSNEPRPRDREDAPKGAYLGDAGNGTKHVSDGMGGFTVQGHGSNETTTNNAVTPEQRGAGSPAPVVGPASFGVAGHGGGGGPVGTSVNQAAAENAGGGGDLVGGGSPRSDFSVVLAGQTGNKPNRGPALSNKFVSIVGSAGGLGRKSSAAKRTLIGGA